MKTLQTGDDKIQQICTALRQETLQPAEREAEQILKRAEEQSRQIISQAKAEALALITAAQKQQEQERRVFESSISQAAKQLKESIKQQIEQEFFQKELSELVEKDFSHSSLIANLLEVIVEAIGREGLDVDLEALIARNVDPSKVAELVAGKAIERIKKLQNGDFSGGAKVRLEGKNMMIDISAQTISELLATYVHESFRKLFFR